MPETTTHSSEPTAASIPSKRNRSRSPRMAVELETVLTGGTFDDWRDTLLSEYAITATLVSAHSDSGGHPVVRYEGPRNVLAAMLVDHFSANTREGERTNFMLRDVVRVPSPAKTV